MIRKADALVMSSIWSAAVLVMDRNVGFTLAALALAIAWFVMYLKIEK